MISQTLCEEHTSTLITMNYSIDCSNTVLHVQQIPAHRQSCTNNGNCCTSAPLPMFLLEEEQHRQQHQEEEPCSKRLKVHSRRQISFQEENKTHVFPLHEACSPLWYNAIELKAIHKEIFLGLVEAKEGNNKQLPANFEFSARGLEEIRKRKPHKRQIRRQEYIQTMLALQQRGNAEAPVASNDSEHATFVLQQSRSATLRALHYAALDADEACLVYRETFGMKNAKTASGAAAVNVATTNNRRVTVAITTGSTARSA